MQLCRDTKGAAESLAKRHGIGLTRFDRARLDRARALTHRKILDALFEINYKENCKKWGIDYVEAEQKNGRPIIRGDV